MDDFQPTRETLGFSEFELVVLKEALKLGGALSMLALRPAGKSAAKK